MTLTIGLITALTSPKRIATANSVRALSHDVEPETLMPGRAVATQRPTAVAPVRIATRRRVSDAGWGAGAGAEGNTGCTRPFWLPHARPAKALAGRTTQTGRKALHVLVR